MTIRTRRTAVPLAAALVFALPRLASPQDGLDSGDTAWMLTSSVLVLFMPSPDWHLSTPGWCAPKTSYPS